MLRSCALLALDDAWFVAGGVAAVSVSLSVDGVESVAAAGQLRVVPKPAWHGRLGAVRADQANPSPSPSPNPNPQPCSPLTRNP